MATDYAKLAVDLGRFYDFSGKVVLYVGAGTRQLLDPAAPIRRMIAIDKDETVLRELKAKVAAEAWGDRIALLAADFLQVELHGDVVYFEFCLHEMNDPERALLHAKSLARDVVVYDHSPGSAWVFYCDEEEKVVRSTAAMQRLGVRRRETFSNVQRFADHTELLAKIGSQGPTAVDRARPFVMSKNIVIPMTYELDLL